MNEIGTDTHEELGEKEFNPKDALDELRVSMQTFIDPKTGGGRGLDAEFGGDKLLDKLGVNTPNKALDVLKAAIEAGYDPMIELTPLNKGISRTTWSTVLSGLLGNELRGDVTRGDKGDDPEIWFEVIEDFIDKEESHVDQSEKPVHDIYDNQKTTYSPQEYWLAQIRGLLLRSVKLAAKRALNLDRSYGFKREDDETTYPSAGEVDRQPDVAAPNVVAEVGRTGLRGLFRLRR